MRLNLQSDYALRVLTHLDVRRGELVTIKEIADRFRISQNHLMKVAYLLGREGFIATVRGRSGGLRLIRRSDTIRIGDVVRSMENDLALVECPVKVVANTLTGPAGKTDAISWRHRHGGSRLS